MLIIHQSRILDGPDGVKLETPVTEISGNEKIEHRIWCETTPEYGDFFDIERSDAALIGLLPYAWKNHHELVAETPVTKDLLYNFNEFLNPLMRKYYPELPFPRIEASPTSDVQQTRGVVGTGMSLGIDSMFTLQRHGAASSSLLKPTHLFLFNVGYHSRGEKAQTFYLSHLKKVREMADEFGYNLVTLNSNYADEFRQHYVQIHIYAAAFAVYSLAHLFGDYLYASSGKFNGHIDLDGKWMDREGGDYLAFMQFALSTRYLRFHADAEHASRIEETAALADFAPAKKYLYVCTKETENCCRCSKCIRTLLALKALGVRKNFEKTFPVERESLFWEIRVLLKRLKRRDLFFCEIVAYKLRSIKKALFSRKKKAC